MSDSLLKRFDRGTPPSAIEQRLDDLLDLQAMGWTLEQMGAKYGITRERVRQILDKAGSSQMEVRAARMARLRAIPRTCRYCGKQYMANDNHFAKGTHVGVLMYPKNPQKVAEDKQIVADYDAGMKTLEICKKWGCNPHRISRALFYAGREPSRQTAGKVMKTRQASAERMMAIVRDYLAGELLNHEIATKHGVSPGMIQIALRFAGVRSRTSREAQHHRNRIFAARGLDHLGRPKRR